jgi:hypothetical protein
MGAKTENATLRIQQSTEACVAVLLRTDSRNDACGVMLVQTSYFRYLLFLRPTTNLLWY